MATSGRTSTVIERPQPVALASPVAGSVPASEASVTAGHPVATHAPVVAVRPSDAPQPPTKNASPSVAVAPRSENGGVLATPVSPSGITVASAAPVATDVSLKESVDGGKMSAGAVTTVTDADVDDYSDDASASTTTQSNCGTYFSAYGVTPNQFQWIEINLKKRYPNVCPAPLPSMVDFVVIFTHDVNFYNYTMPTPVHTVNGFSDWEPVELVDSALVSRSQADKNKHEYVWVFHVRRGSFNPGTFSSRRRPQFTKIESNTIGDHASDRTLEDALQFIQGEGPTNP
ncbi:MAG: hypothetical protein ACRD4S_11075 [Candidatus Acidiferrales bacterium]